MKVKIGTLEYECVRAVRGTDTAILYLTNGGTAEIDGVSDWSGVILEGGTWEAEHPDPNAKPLEELRADKLEELSDTCNDEITAGCDVVLSSGSGHISLTAEDQINLSMAMTAVEQGVEGYPYHLDGQLCAIFPAADIQTMAQTATRHKLEHTTYYNHLAAWVRRCETAEELSAIAYGAELPADLAANMAAILAAAGGGGDV